jgi:hypothetical protein
MSGAKAASGGSGGERAFTSASAASPSAGETPPKGDLFDLGAFFGIINTFVRHARSDGRSGRARHWQHQARSVDAFRIQRLGERRGHRMSQWWHLWQRWSTGEQLTGMELWGHSLIFWARLGKLLQFLSGLTVILDLIGPDPLRSFGRRLLRVSWRKSVSKPAENVAVAVFLVSLLGYLAFLVLLFTSDFFSIGGEMVEVLRSWGERLDGSWLEFLFCFVGIIVFWVVAGAAIETKPGKTKSEYKGDAMVVAFLTPAVIVAGLAVVVLLLPWIVFIYAVCLPVSRGLAALLDSARPAHPLRWIALAMFVVGFHLDLLAS